MDLRQKLPDLRVDKKVQYELWISSYHDHNHAMFFQTYYFIFQQLTWTYSLRQNVYSFHVNYHQLLALLYSVSLPSYTIFLKNYDLIFVRFLGLPVLASIYSYYSELKVVGELHHTRITSDTRCTVELSKAINAIIVLDVLLKIFTT